MHVGQEHHGRVTVAMAVGFGRFDQLFDFISG
jgi:hypothetical protein